MRTFNRNRYHILLDHYFSTKEMLRPDKVNRAEPVLKNVSRFFRRIDLGCGLSGFNAFKDDPKALDQFSLEKYLVKFNLKGKRLFHKIKQVATPTRNITR